MSQAIDVVPNGLGIATAVAAALWALPTTQPSPPPPLPEASPERVELPVLQTQPQDPCTGARGVLLAGHVTPAQTSHVRLAGPVFYADVTTDRFGAFELRVPIEGQSEDVCALLPSTRTFRFADDATTLEYAISIER
jgi:hypothetical protein